MPLVAHSDLPTFERLRAAGQEVLTVDRARGQEIRELHIGFLNMMPDAALEATERQFMRLVGASNRIAQLFVHPFTVRGIPRHGRARDHVECFYADFEELAAAGLDALILTGANPADPDLRAEPFWDGLVEVVDWARDNVGSVLCSCLATHAVIDHFHGIERVKLPAKRWGVYSHRLTGVARGHPLVAGINTRFDAPHSHVYDMPAGSFEASGAHVLVTSEEAGVHMAVSADGFRWVFFQGHPEYDFNSLLKEFKREVGRFIRGERDDYPPFPEHYFGAAAGALLGPFEAALREAVDRGDDPPPLPETALEAEVDNTWTDTGKALFSNWLGLVHQLTDTDRRRPFMAGVDPEDPLGWRPGPG